MDFRDYYKILGVESGADDKAIKTAYRKLARKYHPDVSDEKDAEEKFKEVTEAYEILHDANKRAEYDELLQYGGQQGESFEPPPGWKNQGSSEQFSGEFSDFFESIFGGRGQGPRADAGFHGRGQDVEIEMPIFLEDTLATESKKIGYQLPHYDSNGSRLADIKKTLNIKIPTGVIDGQRIRLKGQGGPGLGKAESGDLFLRVRLVPHPLFDLEGHNLIITLPLAPWEAALGTKITVPTLSGKIQLTIPANSQSGKRLRIKGKGLPSKLGQGDLYAVLNVVMPPVTDDSTNKLWEELAVQAKFDPRKEWS